MKIKNYLLLIVLLIVFHKIEAHPHVFINTSITFVFDMDGNISGVKSKWVFDENFSATIKLDYDKNNDGQFSKEESDTVESEAFDNLKDVHYFTSIIVDGEKHLVEKVDDFRASITDNKIVYEFFIPFHINVETISKKIKILIYDESYYIDVEPVMENYIRLENDFNLENTISKYDDITNKYYFDQIFPVAMVLDIKRMW